METSSIHLDVIRDLKRINGHLTSVAYPISPTPASRPLSP
jgi:phosphate:Na+ symporter